MKIGKANTIKNQETKIKDQKSIILINESKITDHNLIIKPKDKILNDLIIEIN